MTSVRISESCIAYSNRETHSIEVFEECRDGAEQIDCAVASWSGQLFGVQCIALSPTAQYLVSCGLSDIITVWNARDDTVALELVGHDR